LAAGLLPLLGPTALGRYLLPLFGYAAAFGSRRLLRLLPLLGPTTLGGRLLPLFDSATSLGLAPARANSLANRGKEQGIFAESGHPMRFLSLIHEQIQLFGAAGNFASKNREFSRPSRETRLGPIF
jgi:hypothetical protein